MQTKMISRAGYVFTVSELMRQDKRGEEQHVLDPLVGTRGFEEENEHELH